MKYNLVKVKKASMKWTFDKFNGFGEESLKLDFEKSRDLGKLKST
jgi:hypothetical protein